MAELGDKRVDLKDLKVLSDYMKEVYATKLQVGGPLKASTAADMTDTDRVYIYTGSETGYTAGGWYYYDGAAWSLGGIYQSDGVETDTTLTLSGEAADAAAVGAAVTGIVDGTLSVPGKAADAETVGDVLLRYNSWNIIANHRADGETATGVTYTWSGEVCTVNGTASSSAESYYHLVGSYATLPKGIDPGKSYIFRCVRSSNNVKFCALFYKDGSYLSSAVIGNDKSEFLVAVPADVTGMRISIRVNRGVTVTNETITDLVVLNAKTNRELDEELDQSRANIAQIESDVNTLMDEEDRPVYEFYGQFGEIEGWFNYAGNINGDTVGEGTPYYHTNLLKIRGGVTYYSGYMTTTSSVVGCLYDRRQNKIGPVLSPVPVFSETKTYAAYTFVKYNGDIYRVKNSHTGPWDDDDFILRTDVTEIFPIYPAYEFNPAVKYSKGRYVHYNNKYWKFTEAHQPGTWVGTDVEEVPYGYHPDQAADDEPDVGYFPTSGIMTSYRYTVPENAAYISINLGSKTPDAAYYRHLLGNSEADQPVPPASVFDANTSYTAGTYVVYGHTQDPGIKDDKMYVVKSGGHSAGPWDPSHFTVQNLSGLTRYRQYVSSRDNFMVCGSGNIVIHDSDAWYQRYKNKKLFIIGPSTTAINRLMRSGSYGTSDGEQYPRFVNDGPEYKALYDRVAANDKVYNDAHGTALDNRLRVQRGYIAGYQEYIKPYFADVKCVGYSGASIPYGRGSEKKCSIYTRVMGGYEKVQWKVSVPVFDPAKDYQAGTYVIYDGEYYKFLMDHDAGPWNPDPDPETGEYEVEQVTQEEATTRYREYDLPEMDLSGYDVFYINTDGNGVNGTDLDADYKSRDKNYYTGALRLIVEKILRDNGKAEIYLATRAESRSTAAIFHHLNAQIILLNNEVKGRAVDLGNFSGTSPLKADTTYDGKHSNNDGNQTHASVLTKAIIYGSAGATAIDSTLKQDGAAADAFAAASMIEQTAYGTAGIPLVIGDASDKPVKTAAVFMPEVRENAGTPSAQNPIRFVPYTGVDIVVSKDGTEDEDQSVTYSVDWEDEYGGAFYGTFNPVTGSLYRRNVYDPYTGEEPLPGEWRSSMDPYVAGTLPTIGAQVIDLGTPGETIDLSDLMTPGLLKSLFFGENHIWEKNGLRMNITYRCDTKLYIDARIAEIQG